jgi:hypothetical protein
LHCIQWVAFGVPAFSDYEWSENDRRKIFGYKKIRHVICRVSGEPENPITVEFSPHEDFLAGAYERKASWSSAELGTMTIKMLDAGAVAPDDLIPFEFEDPGDAVSFVRAGQPPTFGNRHDALHIQTGQVGQLGDGDSVLGAQLGKRSKGVHELSPHRHDTLVPVALQT